VRLRPVLQTSLGKGSRHRIPGTRSGPLDLAVCDREPACARSGEPAGLLDDAPHVCGQRDLGLGGDHVAEHCYASLVSNSRLRC
jgi:hypothetical protein